jgi:hypothetical protein
MEVHLMLHRRGDHQGSGGRQRDHPEEVICEAQCEAGDRVRGRGGNQEDIRLVREGDVSGGRLRPRFEGVGVDRPPGERRERQGPDKFLGLRVRIVSTAAPAWVNLLARSAAL